MSKLSIIFLSVAVLGLFMTWFHHHKKNHKKEA